MGKLSASLYCFALLLPSLQILRKVSAYAALDKDWYLFTSRVATSALKGERGVTNVACALFERERLTAPSLFLCIDVYIYIYIYIYICIHVLWLLLSLFISSHDCLQILSLLSVSMIRQWLLLGERDGHSRMFERSLWRLPRPLRPPRSVGSLHASQQQDGVLPSVPGSKHSRFSRYSIVV